MVAIEGADIISAGFAGVCAAGGVLFLKVAVLGGSWWPLVRQEVVAQPSTRARVACLISSCILIIGGFAALQFGRRDVSGAAKENASASKDRVATETELSNRLTDLEQDKSAAARIAALSVELRTLRAGVMVGDALGSSCSPINGNGSKTLVDWSEKETSACDKFKNAQWTVELGGALKSKAAELIKELNALNIRYVFGSVPSDQSDALSDNLGMVFDDRVPHVLICRLRAAYSRATGLQLQGAVLQQTYVNVVRSPISTFAIHLGVPFREVFDGNYAGIRETKWESMCADKAEFDDWFQNNNGNFKAKIVLAKKP
jgi:hypothetical protein